MPWRLCAWPGDRWHLWRGHFSLIRRHGTSGFLPVTMMVALAIKGKSWQRLPGEVVVSFWVARLLSTIISHLFCVLLANLTRNLNRPSFYVFTASQEIYANTINLEPDFAAAPCQRAPSYEPARGCIILRLLRRYHRRKSGHGNAGLAVSRCLAALEA